MRWQEIEKREEGRKEKSKKKEKVYFKTYREERYWTEHAARVAM
jgi:hypothetical protein